MATFLEGGGGLISGPLGIVLSGDMASTKEGVFLGRATTETAYAIPTRGVIGKASCYTKPAKEGFFCASV